MKICDRCRNINLVVKMTLKDLRDATEYDLCAKCAEEVVGHLTGETLIDESFKKE